ncbi:component of SufBCD complex [Rubellimicrobium rubrum]|uniref:Component of SufBCD complex n=1 Tax=Rubellimicrobium rubrum TaxID=2585369 RepID=A0A5C4N2J6_9RHOB|nr:component of SufBCD complex [Rubellimicrobium rubrum]TNC51151.1 component of SufBCD complex [Rubellimicrobium rubrum]
MDWTQTLFEVIDFRSFSNLWFWIVLAVIWSSASHWVLGVPFDLVIRARRHGGQALADLEDLVRINVNRLLYISEMSGLWLAGLVAFVLTLLFILAVWYGVEFAQAVILLATPMTIVGTMSLVTARRIHTEAPHGDALFQALVRHRLRTQIVGMVAIFITAMFGMYQNLQVLQGL